jgi:hemoglobin
MSMNRIARCAIGFAALIFASGAQAQTTTLYDDLGGHDGLKKIIDASVANYVSDDRIKGYFEDVSLDHLKGQLFNQFCQLSGGPCVYTGHDMHTVHKGFHLSQADFTALVEDLQRGMDSCNVPFRTQNRLLALLAPMESQVVTR